MIAWSTPTPRRQRGVAIITAVVIAAMVAAIAGFMAFRQGLWLRQVENQHDIAQARSVALAAVDVIKQYLRDDAKQGNVDSAKEVWNQNFPTLPVEKGQVMVRVRDSQGKFNINNLISAGVASQDDVDIFERILAAEGLPPAQLVPALLDWMDPDSETRFPGGAEDREYLSMEPPRRAANRALIDLGELAQVKGWTPDMVHAIEPYVVALPPGQLSKAINVNFARPELLVAMMPNLDIATARTLTKRAVNDPFTSFQDFLDALPQALAQDATKLGTDHLNVETHYFAADIDVRFGRVNLGYHALLERSSDNLPQTIWLRRK